MTSDLNIYSVQVEGYCELCGSIVLEGFDCKCSSTEGLWRVNVISNDNFFIFHSWVEAEKRRYITLIGPKIPSSAVNCIAAKYHYNFVKTSYRCGLRREHWTALDVLSNYTLHKALDSNKVDEPVNNDDSKVCIPTLCECLLKNMNIIYYHHAMDFSRIFDP